MNKKILVFAPHPDDETLGCGGTIARKTREGYEALVIILTDGRYVFSKTFCIDSDPSPIEVEKIRKDEVTRAVQILGVPGSNLIFLNLEDGTLEKKEKEAEEEITELLRKHCPIEVYIPYQGDGHPDHQTANRIIRRSLLKAGITCPCFQYAILHKHSRIGPLIERARCFFKRGMIEVDISEYLDLKQKAIGEFKSQILLISSQQEKPVLTSQRIEGYLGAKEKFHIIQ